MQLNIIGDIAGQYKTLMALVAQLPPDPIILVGDLIDRGPQSREVVEWAMTTPHVHTVLANHELMMVQHITGKDKWNNWLVNGGFATLESYRDADGVPMIPKEHVDWMAANPPVFETDNLIVSHCPLSVEWDTIDSKNFDVEAFVWYRGKPRRYKKYSVFGHNSMWGLRDFEDGLGPYATCIDTSASKVLTAMHWPSRKVYQQPYLDKKDFYIP